MFACRPIDRRCLGPSLRGPGNVGVHILQILTLVPPPASLPPWTNKTLRTHDGLLGKGDTADSFRLVGRTRPADPWGGPDRGYANRHGPSEGRSVSISHP